MLLTHDSQNITRSTVVERSCTLDGGTECILTLVRVLEDTKEHVDEVDEDISNKHSLPEIPWVAHLSEEIEKEHSSSISVDDTVDTLERAEEAYTTGGVTVRWGSSKFPDWDVTINCSVREINFAKWNINAGTEGAEHGSIIRFGVGSNTNSDERDKNGCQDGKVGEPSETLESTNLSKDHTKKSDNEEADNEAQSVAMFSVLANGDLRYFASFTENKHGYQHDHLEGLENVDQMSHSGAKDTEKCLSKIAERVTV